MHNTLQQYVLFVIGTLALSVSLPASQLKVIAAAIIVFIVARFAFWIGYRVHPLYWAFGMGHDVPQYRHSRLGGLDHPAGVNGVKPDFSASRGRRWHCSHRRPPY